MVKNDNGLLMSANYVHLLCALHEVRKWVSLSQIL